MVEKNPNSARQTAEMIAVILTLNEDENREALISFLYDKLGLELGYGVVAQECRIVKDDIERGVHGPLDKHFFFDLTSDSVRIPMQGMVNFAAPGDTFEQVNESVRHL